MKIMKSPGICYDMIAYSIIFFNREALVRKFQGQLGVPDEFFSDYEAIRMCGCVDPPPDLYPFFCLYMDRPSVMSEYFDAKFDFFHDTVETYLSRLKGSAEFRRYIYSYYLSDFGEQISIDSVLTGDSESVCRALALLAQRVSITNFQNLFHHFGGVVDHLAKYFDHLKPHVEAYQNDHKERYDIAKDFIKVKNEAVLKKICSGTDRAELFTFSVTMMNKYLIMRQGEPVQNIYAYILGYDCLAALSEAIDYGYMTTRGVLAIMGDGLSADIIEQLCERDMTALQLCGTLHASRSSVLRRIDELCNELVITRIWARKEVYYRLNRVYMTHAKALINDFLDQCIQAQSPES